jgi:hypothetical protein
LVQVVQPICSFSFSFTSVSCAIGPSVTTSSNDFFPFQHLVFFGEFIWIFSSKKLFKNQYLPHIWSPNSIK